VSTGEDSTASSVPGYETLAGVYEWLMPDGKLTPAGSVDAFGDVVRSLPVDAHVLDCSCGTGQLAVGLAARGLTVVASDASAAMVRRTQELAAEHGVELRALEARWEVLSDHLEPGTFEMVFCVGNSLAHATGTTGRLAALGAMSRLLRPGGRLVLTSRTWESVRAGGTRIDVRDHVIRRDGRDGVLIYHWQIEDRWEDEHHLEIAVALLEADGSIRSYSERLSLWPYRYDDLVMELAAFDLEVESSTFDAIAEAYTVVARRREVPFSAHGTRRG
jgi:SAM-dependent methyltransferase